MEILSRCGIDCSSCKYKEILGCKGCANLDRPFWGECEVKNCCEDRGFETCGQCHKCPCDVLTEMASDPKEGDGGLRIRNTREWAAALAAEEAAKPFEGEEDWSEDFDEDEPEYEGGCGCGHHREESKGCEEEDCDCGRHHGCNCGCCH